MIRHSVIFLLFVLAGCADQSKGTALNECRLKYYLDSAAVQSGAIPDCMAAKSFQFVTACNPEPDDRVWDWQVRAFIYDNPKCYQTVGSATWWATLVSPM